MTRPQINNTCDLCQNEIDNSEMSYTISFNQRQPYGSGMKNRFVSSTNKADLCKSCLVSKFSVGNFKIRWKTMEKQENGTWAELDPQEKLVEA